MFAMLHQLKFKIIIPKFTTLVLNIISRQDKKKKKKKTGLENNNLAPIQKKKYHHIKEKLETNIPTRSLIIINMSI